VFHSGAGGLSVMAAAIGGGAILGGLWLGERAHKSGLTWIALGSSLASAIAAVLTICTDRLWLAVPGLAVFGFAMSTSGIAVQTLIQLASDRSMRGRVMGLYGLIFRGAPAVGALGAGIASAHLGLRWPVVIGALLVVAVWLWAWMARERITAALESHNPDAED
jgi:predicted MFS family arabinose efflux permease